MSIVLDKCGARWFLGMFDIRASPVTMTVNTVKCLLCACVGFQVTEGILRCHQSAVLDQFSPGSVTGSNSSGNPDS